VRFSRAYLYAVLAVAAAVAYGVGEGQYWVTDLEVFVGVVSVVTYLCFARRAKTESMHKVLRIVYQPRGPQGSREPTKSGNQEAMEPDPRERLPEETEHIPRSRMAHYAIVSRTKSRTLTDWLHLESDSPFERVLFGEPGWRKLSGDDLEEISRKASTASAKNAQ
jgi:hypothetical protein